MACTQSHVRCCREKKDRVKKRPLSWWCLCLTGARCWGLELNARSTSWEAEGQGKGWVQPGWLRQACGCFGNHIEGCVGASGWSEELKGKRKLVFFKSSSQSGAGGEGAGDVMGPEHIFQCVLFPPGFCQDHLPWCLSLGCHNKIPQTGKFK